MNDARKDLTTGYEKELPSILFACLKACPALLTSPKLLLSFLISALKNDWDSDSFRSARMKKVLISMYSEKTSKVEPFPKGSKIIIANHTYLPGILSCICRRIPENEKMPHILTDVSYPYRIFTNRDIGIFKRFIAKKLFHMELTASFCLPTAASYSCQNRKAKILSEMRKKQKVSNKESNRHDQIPVIPDGSSIIILIENKPSRGIKINSYNKVFERYAIEILKKNPNTPLIFLGLNSETKIAEQEVYYKGRNIPKTISLGDFAISQLRNILRNTAN